MKGKLLLFAALGGMALLLPSWGTSDQSKDRWLAHEIMIDGPALFYSVENDLRRELWSVHCSQPLRGCVARANGLALRLDSSMRPWLIAAASAEARISLQEKNYTSDVPGLFSAPLSDEMLARLSAPDSFVVIEERGRVIQRTRTEAIARVASYLRWVNGDIARTLRDARLWPDEGRLDPADMSPSVLERYEVMQRRRKEGLRQLVPSTKPQIEFAIQAQGGTSFYSPTGKSGY